MHSHLSTMLSSVFHLLPDFVAAAPGIMIPEHQFKIVVELDKDLQVMKTRPHSETLVYSPMKRKGTASAASLFQFRNSRRNSITVLCASGLISMNMISQKSEGFC